MASFTSSFVASDVAGTFRTASCSHKRQSKMNIVSKMSRIGKLPIVVPDKVKVTLEGNAVSVKGPRGELRRTLSPLVKIDQEGDKIVISKTEDTKTADQQHGLSRSLVNNMVVGVSDGYTKSLTLIGVGYRAAVSGKSLTLSLGYSHPVEMPIPEGIEVKVEKNTSVTVSGYDKEQVGQFAADIRSKREPEPYKGKGVRYVDEYVARKEGKRGK